jgi:hypothetical protein
MQRIISVTTASQFCEALENWIIDNKLNPQTPEEWNRCVEDMMTSGVLTPIGVLADEAKVSELKTELKKNFNVEEL